ncbi:MAG: DUF4167 domain-containing protein [Hyphomicrobium sp.]|nr:DUF4167 domain-containing protein [Hyphomicrobium sp.]PPC82884.1 MAG: hypothetical protein CTY40_03680 [Hyphomicrobium sp.]
MRQGQQNRRGRGRNTNGNNNNNNHSHQNGNRKGQNPTARSFESNGPDVKLRGTPAHIAEKYVALARDAQSSGDPVLAENYLQHAEHYNRIILAYREQQIAQGGDPGGMSPRNRQVMPGDPLEAGDGFGEDDGDDAGGEGGQPFSGIGDQPPTGIGPVPQRFDGRPQRDSRQDNANRGEHQRPQHRDRQGEPRTPFQDRAERPERVDRDRQERPDRPDRPDRPNERLQERPERVERFDRPERMDRPVRVERPERIERVPQPVPGNVVDAVPRRRERFQPAAPAHEQPEFLRRPVRRPRRDDSGEALPPVPAPVVGDDQD